MVDSHRMFTEEETEQSLYLKEIILDCSRNIIFTVNKESKSVSKIQRKFLRHRKSIFKETDML